MTIQIKANRDIDSLFDDLAFAAHMVMNRIHEYNCLDAFQGDAAAIPERWAESYP